MNWNTTKPKIGDWVRPTDPIICCINYCYNFRLIIEIASDEDFITTCESFGIEKGLWNIYNTEFIARLILE